MARRRHQTKISGILDSLASDLGIAIIVALVLIGVYLLDSITPLGQPVWLLYFIPLILAYWSERYYAVPAVSIVTLLFLVGGFLVSPQGIPVANAILNRMMFFLAFISLSIILWAIRRQQITGSRIF